MPDVWAILLTIALVGPGPTTTQAVIRFDTEVQCGIAYADWQKKIGQPLYHESKFYLDKQARLLSISPCGDHMVIGPG